MSMSCHMIIRISYQMVMDGDTMETLNGNTMHPHRIHHVYTDHQSSAFLAMNCMRQKGQLCDISLQVGDEMIHAHKVVLAASSAYFHAMFNNEMAEKHKSEITMHDVDASALQKLIEFAYTGEIVITEENVQALLPVASLLQVSTVRDACCKFLLRQLHPSNCLGIRSFADAHACEELQRKSHKYALQNFQEVALTEEFLLLPFSQVEDLMSSNKLNVPSEECVYNAVMTWIKHDLTMREEYLGKLMQHVRLPLIGRDFLLTQIGEEPLIQSNQESKDLLIEAMKYHLMPEHRTNMISVRTTQRKPEELRPYIFAIGGGSLFTIHSECECYNPRTDRWYPTAPTLQRRSRAGVAAVNRLVYAVGGYDGTKDLASTEYFNPHTSQWIPVNAMGTKRSCLGITTLNGLIYVAGGYDGASCLNSVERYDPLVGTWSSVVAMETRRRYCRLGVLDGCIYAVGGYDGANYLSSIERYDPREGKWRPLQTMINRRSSCGVTTLDGMLYAVGGNDGSLCMCTMERFDPVRNAWEAMPSMQSRRTTHEVIEAEGYLYAVGGNDGSSSLNTVERYNPRHNKWMLVTSMTLRRSSVGVAVVDSPCMELILTRKSGQ
ncbi:kelch-like protein 17 isoform X2 [Centruroides sculpturatus]|uniref:kelch-like protein 17 isoform X2 n=1 Tax=Centruroides sculpturatus TaxID=218467 RepID=UPI000C6E5297|nr:kelch-like protein 17 isoform X2 [Centruroides sculpturatus]XP_023216556.1 kelch-like protein 17 isoform X2 [Centruroides sculpturatus]XP_023216564.1 kelch-like protein 17 isoform X2 [Centruroides sculpturatus]XP_023216571.1 kelch-like protein 17 isoform X2 [Centruroides sculpturatus]